MDHCYSQSDTASFAALRIALDLSMELLETGHLRGQRLQPPKVAANQNRLLPS